MRGGKRKKYEYIVYKNGKEIFKTNSCLKVALELNVSNFFIEMYFLDNETEFFDKQNVKIERREIR